MKATRALTLFLALALLALVLLAFSAPAARAADPVIVRVTTTGTRTWPCGDQTNWSNPCALQTALSNTVSPSELWVAAGTYTPTMGVTRTATFHLVDGVALYGGFAMTETLRTQRNFTANVTLLSGDLGTLGFANDNAFHVVTGNGVTNTAVLDGFTVIDGNANVQDIADPNSRGGGLYNDGGNPTLANVTFISNTAYAYAGGMYSASSNPTLTNVTFSSNASLFFGGGMYNYASNPALTNVAFIDNFDGGMLNVSSSPTLANVTFSGNVSGLGGGMLNRDGSNPTLTNVTFTRNFAARYGGGMFNDASNPTLTNVTFAANNVIASGWVESTTCGGSGMYNTNSSPTLMNVTFISNTASGGGGMSTPAFCHGAGMYNVSSSPTLTNVTFSGNSVKQASGGGMYNEAGSNPTLTNVTFAANNVISVGPFTVYGGGMFNASSSPTIRNTLFWGNTASNMSQISGSQIADSSSTPNISYSVVQGGYVNGTHIITADPRLGALGNYGGSTQTIPLLPGSSAIDAGNDAFCPSTDQRGVPRPQGAHCDTGAYESQGFTLTKTSGDGQSALVNAAFATPLGVGVSSAFGEPVNGGGVTFAAPLSGASVVPVTSTVVITSGAAARTLMANGTAGSFVVTANTAGTAAPVTFTLTSTTPPYFLPLIAK